MKLHVNLALVTPHIDYLYRIGGYQLSKANTAILAARTMNFTVSGSVTEGDSLVIFATHPGDAEVCAKWMGEKLGQVVRIEH